ncbi:MAG TPA: molybdenum cofactor guanylyltransferase [Gemmatimonadales bacterium]|nr:molybdenum cofactor guanylyltransferase [Gemmatimonadales bacterium]
MNVGGAILAGGGATRFGGGPKGLERVGGTRIIDRLAALLEGTLGRAPLLVANSPEAASWVPGLRVVGDVVPGAGSLGGILTAVVEAPAPVVCVAWDMPFVTEGLIRELARGLESADACLPESGGRRGVEPLCAAYGAACRGPIEACIAAGDLRAIGFHPQIRVATIPAKRIAELGDPERLFFNVNTAQELTQAELLWRRESSP